MTMEKLTTHVFQVKVPREIVMMDKRGLSEREVRRSLKEFLRNALGGPAAEAVEIVSHEALGE